MNKKQLKRLTELDLKAKGVISSVLNSSSNCEHFTSEEIQEHNELEFLRNKENVDMRLTGKNKYYNAYQCYDFLTHIKTSGYNRYKANDIESVYITSSPYYGAKVAARLNSGGVADLKSFNENKELLNFIIGFNEALYQVSN